MESVSSLASAESAQITKDELEVIWQMGVASMVSNNEQMVIPKYVAIKLSEENIDDLKARFSQFYDNCCTETVVDHVAQVFRIRKAPEPALVGNSPFTCRSLPSPSISPQSHLSASEPYHHGSHDQTGDTGNKYQPVKAIRLPGKKSKVPRPPNAFILYRQKHHPIVRATHPLMKNNDISILLGQQWKAESEDVKAQYKVLADKMKVKHALENPGYQYAPRKASEKKRRMTARKLAKLHLSDPKSDAQANPDIEMDGAKGKQRLDDPETGAVDVGPRTFTEATPFPLPVSASAILGTERASYPSQLELHEDGEMSLDIPTGHSHVEHDYMVKMDAAIDLYESPVEHKIIRIPYDRHGRTTIAAIEAAYAEHGLNYMDDLVDWEGINSDIEILATMLPFGDDHPEVIHPGVTEAATTKPTASIVGFDDDRERLEFQERLDNILWMLE
ncbi:hypothetical protein A1O3_06089 [Capronia epimyces CBS 606.96]|uniref:HMG box domain-containing protein n=1 Tax=Capronia epimyces CBS 606.96 TaxID=1182542 RepID=W9XZ69_9EURO|nr:uncharacterized protein A1O3_06089 [Capronia epimyces CBS 606.96]EXJ82276.1 hypothetical protein A1O3_06089 [Capronia epimyces CBS 606.96]